MNFLILIFHLNLLGTLNAEAFIEETWFLCHIEENDNHTF
jgi:hypothetical protein